MARTSSITLQNVTVETQTIVGEHYRPLDGLSLRFTSGERVGLIGQNGSGKTTLARLLVGLDKPTHGRILHRPGSARNMLVFQRPEDHFTRDTVFAEIRRYLRHTSDLRKIWDYMEQVNLSRTLENHPLRQLSGGQQRLVAIACALANRPRFLFLDEPMAGLDAASRQMVSDALRALVTTETTGLCIISHHPDDLLGLVDRLLVLHEGYLHFDGPMAECPVEALDLCLAPTDVSVYRWLRVQETQGKPVPMSFYNHLTEADLYGWMQEN